MNQSHDDSRAHHSQHRSDEDVIWGKKERRDHPRLKCKGQAELRIPSAVLRISATVDDLSLKGCGLECESPISVELPMPVEVQLRIAGITVLFAGVLRHVQDGYRAGIEFTSLGERKAEQIRLLMDELYLIEGDRKQKRNWDTAEPA